MSLGPQGGQATYLECVNLPIVPYPRKLCIVQSVMPSMQMFLILLAATHHSLSTKRSTLLAMAEDMYQNWQM